MRFRMLRQPFSCCCRRSGDVPSRRVARDRSGRPLTAGARISSGASCGGRVRAPTRAGRCPTSERGTLGDRAPV